MKNEKNRLVLILILVIVVLLGVISYTFLIRPALSGYTINAQNQGIQYGYQQTISAIMQQAAQCPTTGVPLTFGNVTINIVALECYSQQSAQASSG